MMTTETQKEMILEWLLSGLPLTPLEGFNHFGCTKISTRIGELCDDGWESIINRKLIKVTNRFGKEVRVMQYFL